VQTAEAVVQALVAFADTLGEDFDLIDFLDRVTERSASVLEVDAAGLMLVGQPGTLRKVSASRQDALLLERFQLDAQEGPCFECHRSGSVVTVTDLHTATTRWPRFGQAMRPTGYVAVHAVPMRSRDQIIGALTLFQRREGGLDPTATWAAQALADVASIGLLQQRSIHAKNLLVGQLQTALSSRIVIEQAKGALAERYGLETAQAFSLLRGYARSHQLRLADLSAAVVAGADDIPRPT
jgi:transcriptional regulator with GAF, ATPase, and Fis domain